MRQWIIIVMAVLLAAAGCKRQVVFNHAVHIEQADCLDCHPGGAAEDEAGMPTEEDCLLCHSAEEKEAYANYINADGPIAWQPVHTNTGELIFSHMIHADAGMECEDCHENIMEVKKGSESPMPPMKMCMECHENMNAGTDCEVCHERLTKDSAPDSHTPGFMRTHGHAVRMGPDSATANDCYMCHGKEECIECHREEKPANHNQLWKEMGHGLIAAVDRDRCMTCHRNDYCVTCHQETEPRSHGAAGWNTIPTYSHCNTCHLPYSVTSCQTCHRPAPAHANANIMPPDPIVDGNNGFHDPGDDCRSCHVNKVPPDPGPLNHPDTGILCQTCHK